MSSIVAGSGQTIVKLQADVNTIFIVDGVAKQVIGSSGDEIAIDKSLEAELIAAGVIAVVGSASANKHAKGDN